MDAVGKNGGHTAVALVHPGGISMHTLLNFDPDGRTKLIPFGNPGSAMDNEVNKRVHSTVPSGHVTLSAPFEPVGPCGPVEPDTNNLGFIIAACSHANCVTLTPAVPAGGLLPDEAANEAVIAVTVVDDGTLAVTAENAYGMFCVSNASVPRNGK